MAPDQGGQHGLPRVLRTAIPDLTMPAMSDPAGGPDLDSRRIPHVEQVSRGEFAQCRISRLSGRLLPHATLESRLEPHAVVRETDRLCLRHFVPALAGKVHGVDAAHPAGARGLLGHLDFPDLIARQQVDSGGTTALETMDSRVRPPTAFSPSLAHGLPARIGGENPSIACPRQ